MIFQIGLIAALCILAIYAYFQWRKGPLVAGILLLVTLAGLAFASLQILQPTSPIASGSVAVLISSCIASFSFR